MIGISVSIIFSIYFRNTPSKKILIKAPNGAFHYVQKPGEILLNKVIPPTSQTPKNGALLHPLQTHGYTSLIVFISKPLFINRTYNNHVRYP